MGVRHPGHHQNLCFVIPVGNRSRLYRCLNFTFAPEVRLEWPPQLIFDAAGPARRIPLISRGRGAEFWLLGVEGQNQVDLTNSVVRVVFSFFLKAVDSSGVVRGWDLVQTDLGIKGSVTFIHAMICEISPKKRKHITDNFKVEHAFGDVTHMGRKSSWCYVNEGNMTIPNELDILFAGFVCKAFSTLNRTVAQNALFGDSSSAKTFKGVRDYVRAHKPKVIVLENVKGLLSADPKQMHSKADVIVKIFSALGYHGGYIAANSKEYLLPQNRPRAYFVFHMIKDNDCQLDATRVLAALRTRSQFSLASILGATGEARVCTESPTLPPAVKSVRVDDRGANLDASPKIRRCIFCFVFCNGLLFKVGRALF